MTRLALVSGSVLVLTAGYMNAAGYPSAADLPTATPIKHLVVVVDENVSFDHYFGTYPHAANPPGEPPFLAAPGTPAVDGLTSQLLTANPNGVNPRRLDRSQALTCDQDHTYTGEQQAFDGGRMDRFAADKANRPCDAPAFSPPGLVMDYYDGNTVTALWNYAQHFAMSDQFYSSEFGPSAPGHINLVAGQTHGTNTSAPTPAVAGGSLIATAHETAAFEDCASPGPRVELTGHNIGDLLSASRVSWGWFSGGFRPTSRTSSGTAICGAQHANLAGQMQPDYSPGAVTEPFQYYRSTANPHHLAPTSLSEIGHDGQANHQYDLTDFWSAVKAGRMPAVSYLKPSVYQNGHANQSDPLAEQHFLVETLNRLQGTPEWRSTAVLIVYDDSDGWYDHQKAPIANPSRSAQDALSGTGQCGMGNPRGGYEDRCGYGPRLPLLVISPFSRVNSVDHAVTDQSSVIAFIEDNWLHGRRIGGGSFDASAGTLAGLFRFSHPHVKPLLLDPTTGEPIDSAGARLRHAG